MKAIDTLSQIQNAVVTCRRCSRLVTWREEAAAKKVRRYSNEAYWGKPLPGFGHAEAGLVVVGLAPAAHGGNRTGRMFTGDDSGDWLIRAMHQAGFANQEVSRSLNDGLMLHNAYVTAVVRCAPPKNRPTRDEIDACLPYLAMELDILHPQVVIALGRIAFDGVIKYLRLRSLYPGGWQFRHGEQYQITDPYPMWVLTSYHPSRQNTQTGRLTQNMLQSVFNNAQTILQANQIAKKRL